ncbi:MAG: hypothetical protein ACWGNS_11200 [Burkholderiales bacterium]
MSRLSRDRLLVSLASDAVALVRVEGGLRPRIVDKKAFECDPGFGAAPWQGAVAALEAALASLRAERVDATVVLSNHFVRSAIVKPDATLSGEEEQLGHARFHFTRVYGERARGWDLRLSPSRRGAPRLASALDPGLMPAIAACFPRGAKSRLVSVQPYLMAAFNRWRTDLARDEGWLLLVEPQRACLALIAGRRWAAVQTLRGEYPALEDWAALLDREQLRTDVETEARVAHVAAPETGRAITHEIHGWKLLGLHLPALEGFVPREDARFAMALTA